MHQKKTIITALVNGTSLIEEQKSNLESGNGYIDLVIQSIKNKGGIAILELKHTPDENEDKVLIAEDAIEQIITPIRILRETTSNLFLHTVFASVKNHVQLWSRK